MNILVVLKGLVLLQLVHSFFHVSGLISSDALSISVSIFLALVMFVLIHLVQHQAQINRENPTHKLGEQVLAVVSHQRHSFMNDLQVISGWLQLNNPQRAVEYVKQVRVGLDQESRLVRAFGQELAAILLVKQAQAAIQGVQLKIKWDGSFTEMEKQYQEAATVLARLLEWLVARALQGKYSVMEVQAQEDVDRWTLKLSIPNHIITPEEVNTGHPIPFKEIGLRERGYWEVQPDAGGGSVICLNFSKDQKGLRLVQVMPNAGNIE